LPNVSVIRRIFYRFARMKSRRESKRIVTVSALAIEWARHARAKFLLQCEDTPAYNPALAHEPYTRLEAARAAQNVCRSVRINSGISTDEQNTDAVQGFALIGAPVAVLELYLTQRLPVQPRPTPCRELSMAPHASELHQSTDHHALL
jgi:hypothetical protein